MKSNTRRNMRVYCGMPGRIEAAGGVVPGIVRSLSRGGMFFLARSAIPVGQTVDMQIDFPGAKAVAATGEVRYRYRYVEGDGLGIRFVRLGAEDLASIAHYVNSRAGAPRN